MHGICNRRLVHKEVVEAISDYKKSYLWRCRNIAYRDSTGSSRIEKNRVRVPPRLVWGGRGDKGWCDLVCL